MKRALVSVTNDLVSDQRVHRTCLALIEKGYDVLLIGRKLPGSLTVPNRPYPTCRMSLLFERGVPFYAEYQIRLFFKLLFSRGTLLFSNDLDTLLPNFVISKIKGVPIIYDSHEYFTGVPELQQHPAKKAIWKRVEKMIIPRLKRMITVNESIAGLYRNEYGVNVAVVRNMPMKDISTGKKKSRKELGLPEDKPIILLQGAGINIERGAEEAVEAVPSVNNALLLIIGSGDAIPALKTLVQKLHLESKVIFLPKIPFEELRHYTALVDIGLTLDKDTNLNYRYSLPNKLFDYIHAGIAVIASPLPEVKKLVEQYHIGECVDSVTPQAIAAKINQLLGEPKRLNEYKANTIKAKDELCWENEKKVLEELII